MSLKFQALLKKILMMLCAIGLTGCNSRKQEYAQFPDLCPQTVIVRDLSRQFIENQKTRQIQVRLELDKIRPLCKIEGKQLTFTANPQFIAFRKDLEKFSQIDTHYFIALGDHLGNILSKKSLPLTINFADQERKIAETLDDSVTFPLPQADIRNCKLYVGLDIDEYQIELNRQRYTPPKNDVPLK